MIYVHSMKRAAQYYPERPALSIGEHLTSFRELHGRIRNLAGALSLHGFEHGDRLAILLPNGPEYIQLVYACSWLGVVAVPINTRLSVVEMDRLIEDASPRGLLRHSSLPAPTIRVPWERVLDEQPLEEQNDFCPDPCYDP